MFLRNSIAVGSFLSNCLIEFCCRYCIKAKSKPSTVNDNIDMTDFYDDDYDDYEDDEEDEEEAGDDTDDSGNGES